MKVMTMINRSYSELCQLKTFEERFAYLQLKGIVGESTFGYDRYLNQTLYMSRRWKRARDIVIIRDNGCDLGIDSSDYEIRGIIQIHHMNPLTPEDIELGRDIIFDPEFLICTSPSTHKAIHYGDASLLPRLPIERRRNDTCPWRK